MNIIDMNDLEKMRYRPDIFQEKVLGMTPTVAQKRLYMLLVSSVYDRQSGVSTGFIVYALHQMFFNNDFKVLHIKRLSEEARQAKSKFLELYLKAIKHPFFKVYDDYSIKENHFRMINRSHIMFTSAALSHNLKGLEFNIVLFDDYEFCSKDFELDIKGPIIRATTKETNGN